MGLELKAPKRRFDDHLAERRAECARGQHRLKLMRSLFPARDRHEIYVEDGALDGLSPVPGAELGHVDVRAVGEREHDLRRLMGVTDTAECLHLGILLE